MEAVVLFDYEKQQDDELDLTVGMTIQNVIQVDDGWCEGSYGGKKGMFPDNFVQLKPATAPPPAATATKAMARPPPPDPQPSSDPAPIDPPIVTRPAGQKTKTRRAKVTFSYAAENPDELTLQPGQSVDVLGEEEDGWWRGQVGDKIGLFPSNFVEVVPEETSPPKETPAAVPSHDTSDGAPPQAHPSERRMGGVPVGGVPMGGGMLPRFNPAEVKLKKTVPPPLARKEEDPVKTPELKKKVPLVSKAQLPTRPPPIPPQDTNVEKAKVVFAYTSEQDDELTIQAGDILEVIDKTEQDGWWKVKLNGQIGLVPDNFVELLPSQPSPVREPAKPPPDPTPKKEAKKPPPPPVVQEDEKPDFGVPPTDPLDNSAHKSRAQRPMGVRPPSRSNLHQDEGESTEAPWQKELKSRKKKEPVKLPPAKAPPPQAEPEKKTTPAKIVEKHKPRPPPAKPALDITKPAPPPATTQPPQPKLPLTSKLSEGSPAPSAEPVSANEWKEALEKLREEFTEFKAQIRKEIKTLSRDLDEERKNNASLRIDIDRLKKTHL